MKFDAPCQSVPFPLSFPIIVVIEREEVWLKCSNSQHLVTTDAVTDCLYVAFTQIPYKTLIQFVHNICTIMLAVQM